MNYNLPNNYELNQRYKILKTLGQGGFGITYLATDKLFGDQVCIKELFISGNSTRAENMTVVSQTNKDFSFEKSVGQFYVEAQRLAKYNHPNIVKVKDLFKANQTAYMVMEFVEGETLKEKIKREGPLAEEEGKALMLQLLSALKLVHEKGNLHRDVKPENILITNDNQLVLIDFGSARAFVDGKTITQTAMLTPGYAPIEQYGNRSRWGATLDIYALGATFYYAFTGQKPLAATERALEELAPPHHINPKLSSQLSSLIMLAMAYKPEERFQEVEEIVKALSNASEDFDENDNEATEDDSEPTIENGDSDSTVIVDVEGVSEPEVGVLDKDKEVDSVIPVFEIESKDIGAIDKSDGEDKQKKKFSLQYLWLVAIIILIVVGAKKFVYKGASLPKSEALSEPINKLTHIDYDIAMVFVDGGRFLMGGTAEQGDWNEAAKPVHRVYVDDYLIGKYEVTQALWESVMEDTPSYFKSCNECPVEQISWLDAQNFIDRLYEGWELP